MDQLEVIIFDEPDEYKEKIKGLTFRQWIFAALIVAAVVPTYVLIPMYTPIPQSIARIFVLIEAAVIGFFGFIKINDLNAEDILPYWYRHYVKFAKPLQYVSEEEFYKTHLKEKEEMLSHLENAKEALNENKKEKEVNKKDLKLQKDLEKAKKKYGYIFDENVGNSVSNDSISNNENFINNTNEEEHLINETAEQLQQKLDEQINNDLKKEGG